MGAGARRQGRDRSAHVGGNLRRVILQYKGLQALYGKYGQSGFLVLGFPCNQFGRQEPGTSEQIAQFCKKNYGVTFDMFEKVDVNGKNQCNLYKDLTSPDTNPRCAGPIQWNFEKFLTRALAAGGTRRL